MISIYRFKRSDQIVIIVGLCIGLIAFSYPILTDIFNDTVFVDNFQRMNGKKFVAEEVVVKAPKIVSRDPGEKRSINSAEEKDLR